ncbi:MAG: DUF6377 domain-containing protein [Prevotellaceae bacterium]|jgi:DNA-binding NarL/FixJ family response regulator|nr:DUF6377 domain-containing protein [Prevotellaceae bacterium]
MKRFLLIPALACLMPAVYASGKSDSLLVALDKIIANRAAYTGQKEARIQDLKRQKQRLRSQEERYYINEEIIDNYEPFVCDSAEVYIHENLAIAKALANDDFITESKLRLGFVYSLSGLFVQATDVLRSFDYNKLCEHQKNRYCWNYIRYYENLVKYTDDSKLSANYEKDIERLRDLLLGLLPEGSEEYLKEKAFKLQSQGKYREALDILTGVFNRQEPNTHSHAMAAMSLAKTYRMLGDRALENKYLMLAAISDVRVAVKENEALLVLALNLFEKGDIDRSYNYISVALSDANFYNSRFKNTVIARVQPVIERNYLNKIDKQRQNLRLYAILISIFIVALVITLFINFRQTKIVVKARKNLRRMNRDLVALNLKLSEANIIKEKYIGHFMTRCAHYVNKMDAYRKDVNQKIKSGQIQSLYKPSAKELEKEVEELYKNFDEVFLQLYPDFVNRLNSLLEPDARYEPEDNRLNTELRIFALMRLGITNIDQIADFLRCSLQTIYNYKSKVKNKARKDILNFGEEIRKIDFISDLPN